MVKDLFKIRLSAAMLLAALAMTLSGCGNSQQTDTAPSQIGGETTAAETREDAPAPAATASDGSGEQSADSGADPQRPTAPDGEDRTSAPDAPESHSGATDNTEPPADAPTEPESGEIDNAEVNINDL